VIRVKRHPAPGVLTTEDGAAARERRRAAEHYQDPARRSKAFSFKMYKHGDVKSALNEIFHFKCAYCESRYGPTAPVDIEHFRPKSAVVVQDESLIKPGYYWLASDWDNLLPSCIDCNRARIHPQADAGNDPELTGKANLFPVKRDRRNGSAMNPGVERGEGRLLLNPCRDRPECHLVFRLDAEFVLVQPVRKSRATSRKGRESIRVYGLNRRGLAEERADRRLRIINQLTSVMQALARLQRASDDLSSQRNLAARLKELDTLSGDNQEYAGMSRQWIGRALDELNPEIEQIMENRLDAMSGDSPAEKLMNEYPDAGQGTDLPPGFEDLFGDL